MLRFNSRLLRSCVYSQLRNYVSEPTKTKSKINSIVKLCDKLCDGCDYVNRSNVNRSVRYASFNELKIRTI